MQGVRLPALLVLAAMALVLWVRLLPLALTGTTLDERALLTYTAADGREHVYLPGYDSYFWLRAARNRLETGSACDAIVDGECRDTHTLAPVGGRMDYPHSPHVLAIALVQRVASFLQPGWPLASSAYLVPVLAGMFAVLPAFAIGRRLAGNVGGLWAALFVGLNPMFLMRSGTSDNDVWNVLLPLCLFWAVFGALGEGGIHRRAAYAIAAALICAVHALAWRGWVFGAAVALLGVFAQFGGRTIRLVAAGGTSRRRFGLRRAFVFATVSAAGLFLLARAAGVSPLAEITRLLAGRGVFGTGPATLWPDPFVTVGELARPDLRTIAALTGGLAYFFVAWLGLLLLLLPRRGWRRQHFAALIAGNYLYAYLLQHGSPGRLALMGLLVLPLLAALVLQATDPEPAGTDETAGIVVVVWFLASLYLAFDGTRFVILLLPPAAVAFGVAIGRLHDWLAALAVRQRLPLRIVEPVLLALAGLLLVPPLRAARAGAETFRPRVNDAWWDALARIRDEAPADAIVSTWWPYGYWVAHIAERRVSADGGSLPSRVPYWLARALLAPNERETVGLLRMLDCGSDASTWPEREASAYGRATRAGLDDVAALTLIDDLVVRSRAEAEALARRQKISDRAKTAIPQATHCAPPPAYLILSSELVTVPGWKLLGNWSVARARDASVLRLGSPEAKRDFVSPPLAFLGEGWLDCHAEGDETVCPIPALAARDGGRAAFVHRDGGALAGRLRWTRPGKPASYEPPGEIFVAGSERIESAVFASPISPAVGILVDPDHRRILAGSPDLLRSTFTQLLFLDGRYLRRFEKFDERTGYGGERVATWRVLWNVSP